MALLSRSRRLTPSDAAWIRAVVARQTAGEGLDRPRLDLDRLSAGEAEELYGFVEAACEAGDGVVVSTKLGARFWTLVAKAQGRPGDFYEQRAADAVAAAKTAERETQKRKLRLSKQQQAGLFSAWGELLADEDDDFASDDIAALSVIVSLFCSGRTLAANSSFEGTQGDVALVYDVSFGIVGRTDPESRFTGLDKRLDALEADGWIVQERSGPRRRLRLGPKLRDVLDLGEQS